MHIDSQRRAGASHLFESSWKKPYSDRGVRKILARYASAASITGPISPHRLRHFLSTWLKTQGIDDALIQPYSGHATRKSLEIYSRAALVDAQDAYNVSPAMYERRDLNRVPADAPHCSWCALLRGGCGAGDGGVHGRVAAVVERRRRDVVHVGRVLDLAGEALQPRIGGRRLPGRSATARAHRSIVVGAQTRW